MATSTKYADLGTIIRVLEFDEERLSDKLKPEVYTVGFDPMAGFYLTKTADSLDTPDKIFGSVIRKVEKVIKTYESSDKSMGVLLSGEKGSGKTMTSSLVANHCIREYGLPVVLVDQSFDGAGLVEFIGQLGECVLFIDEFGKKFNDREGEQSPLLGLFDGTSSSKRMIILTENMERDINTYMIDRPGRIHYHFRHGKLDEDIVREFCQYNDIPAGVIEAITMRRESSFGFSFDTLQAIVTEYKRFGGDVDEICKDLNIEQPMNFGMTELVIDSVDDLTNGVTREVTKKSERIPFPQGSESSMVQMKNMRDLNINDYTHITVKSIMSRDGDIFKFNSIDDEGNDLIITGRRVMVDKYSLLV